jgi:Recombination endonuclease VII
MAKECSKCGGPGPFNKNRLAADGLQRWCVRCVSASTAARYKTDPERFRQRKRTPASREYYRDWRKKQDPMKLAGQRRKWSLRTLYNLSLEEYDAMLLAQGGVCAVCKQPETARLRSKTKRLTVDHDHRTGEVRGLLCTSCNSLLGHAHDDAAVLAAAAGYLARRHLRRVG